MKIALWIAAAVAALILLYVFRKAAVSAAWWTLKTPCVLVGKGIYWCYKRRWTLSHRTARSLLFAVIAGVPVVALFPEIFGMARLAGVPMFIRIAFVLAWFVPGWNRGEPLKVFGIDFLGILWRSRPSGPFFLFSPFGVPIERIFKEVPLQSFSKSFPMDIEVRKGKDRDFIPVKVLYSGTTRAVSLVNRLKFSSEEERVSGIQDWVRNLVTYWSHEMATTVDEVYAKMPDIAEQVTEGYAKSDVNGFTLPEYFGDDVHKIAFADIDMPDDLKKVTNEKKKAEEIREAKKVEFKSVQERTKMAIKLGVDPNEAFKGVQVQDEKREAKISELKLTLDKGITDAGTAVAVGITNAVGALIDKLKS